jgi:histidinol-phosphate aminotransferase
LIFEEKIFRETTNNGVLNMQKRLVRVAEPVLDLEAGSTVNRRYPRLTDLRSAVLKLDRNEMTTAPSPKVIEALHKAIATRPLNLYPDSDAEDLRIKISEYVALSPDYISCFGADDMALDNIVRTYLDRDTEIIVNSSHFSHIRHAAATVGARVVDVYHDDPFKPEIESLIDKVGPRTRMIYISNPDDSSGAMFGDAEIVFLLAYAERIMVVVDEAYFEYSGVSVAELTRRFSNLAVVRSFSKAFGLAALKASYVISDPDNLDFIGRIRHAESIGMPDQVAATAALDDLDHTRGYRAEIGRSKEILRASLPQLGYEFSVSPANFLLLKVSYPAEAAEALQQEGILVQSLDRINRLEDYLRITIGTPDQMDRLLLALGRIADRFATAFNRNRLIARADTAIRKNRKTVIVR